MGGTSTTSQTQQSQSAPWQAAQPMLQRILGQQRTDPDREQRDQSAPAERRAGQSLRRPNQRLRQQSVEWRRCYGSVANLQSGLSTLQSQLTPYANGSMIGNNPALQAQLDQIASDTTNQVNGQFAAAGRDMSGMNQQTLARVSRKVKRP
jgi:hypothetical protein